MPEHGAPHFHARYGGQVAVFIVEPLEVVRGELPRRADRLVREWGRLHRAELMRNWERARTGTPVEGQLEGPVFAPLRDPELFAQVKIDAESGTVVWPTGADLDPIVVYEGLPPLNARVVRKAAV